MSYPLNYRSADEENNTTGADENGEGGEEGEGEEGEEGSAEESDSDSERLFREALRQEKYRQKKRKLSGDGGGGGEDDIDTVPGEIPIDILKKMSPLCEKMGITMRQQLGLTMGFVELCGELKYTCYFIQMTFYDWHCNRSGLNQTYNEPCNCLAPQAI